MASRAGRSRENPSRQIGRDHRTHGKWGRAIRQLGIDEGIGGWCLSSVFATASFCGYRAINVWLCVRRRKRPRMKPASSYSQHRLRRHLTSQVKSGNARMASRLRPTCQQANRSDRTQALYTHRCRQAQARWIHTSPKLTQCLFPTTNGLPSCQCPPTSLHADGFYRNQLIHRVGVADIHSKGFEARHYYTTQGRRGPIVPDLFRSPWATTAAAYQLGWNRWGHFIGMCPLRINRCRSTARHTERWGTFRSSTQSLPSCLREPVLNALRCHTSKETEPTSLALSCSVQ